MNKIQITGYLVIENGQSIKHELETPCTPADIDAYRDQLKQQHGSEIYLIKKELAIIKN